MGQAAMPPRPRMTGTLTALCAACQGICCAARWDEAVRVLLVCQKATNKGQTPTALCAGYLGICGGAGRVARVGNLSAVGGDTCAACCGV